MQFETDSRPGYLHAKLSGQFDLRSSLSVMTGIFAACAAAGQEVVPIDAFGVSGTPTVMERYKLSLLLADGSIKLALALRGRRPRVAALGHVPFIAPDRFGEDVAVNRGVDFRVFTDAAQAMAWLAAPGAAP